MSNDLESAIVSLLRAETPENGALLDDDAELYEWPQSEAKVIAEWLDRSLSSDTLNYLQEMAATDEALG